MTFMWLCFFLKKGFFMWTILKNNYLFIYIGLCWVFVAVQTLISLL